MASNGFPVGGGLSSHRGNGFALGHQQFRLPSRTAPIRPAVTTRANSLGQRHGSEELGYSPGNASEREPRRRDRSASASNMIGDPVQQATAYRLTPAGPQEAESVQVAYETLVNRLLTVETSLRQHAQLIGAQSELVAEHFQKQSEFIEIHTKRCNWLHDHIEDTATDVKKITDDHNNKLNIHGLQGGKMVQKFAHIDETLENLKNMVAQSLAAVNSLTTNVSQSQQFPPARLQHGNTSATGRSTCFKFERGPRPHSNKPVQ